uniref:Uncharacterized protein n=1 Tax=Nyssomyia neivai TaxID=330878 RepID=A0A1L8DD91_9DIPT
MTTRSEFKQIQLGDIHCLNTWDIPEGLLNAIILCVDNQWSTTMNTTTIAHLSTTSPEALTLVDLLDVSPDLHATQKDDCLLGLSALLKLVRHNEWELRHTIDNVPLRLHQSWHTRSRNCRNNSIPTLIHIDLTMPAAPGLRGGEHTSTATHIPKCTLPGTVGTTTTDTWNTCNSTTSTPGLSGCLVAGLLTHGIRLTTIPAHQLGNLVHNIRSNGCPEDTR